MTDPFDVFVPTRARTDSPFTVQAEPALALDWLTFPVKGKGTTGNIPKGITGNKGVLDAETVRKFLITRPHGFDNIAVRHTGTIAIDADVYAGKKGAENLAKFAEDNNLPPLPPTYSSTARGDGSPSRQYFYRLPDASVRLKGSPCEDVEICQFHHRFSVVHPSIHPDTGETYFWYLPGVGGFSWGDRMAGMPSVSDLPELPQEWVEALANPVDDLDYDVEITRDIDEFLSQFQNGTPSKPVADAIEKARSQHPGHDETYKGLLNAFMYGREQHPGVRDLINILIGRHRQYLDREHPQRAAAGEVESIVRHAMETAQRKPVEQTYRPYWITPLTPSESQEEGGFTSLGKVSVTKTVAPEPRGVDDDVHTWVLPSWVWEFSPEMQMIYQAALSRQVSPDVVLHSALAIISSLVPHESRLDTGKAPSVLSYYVAAVGGSGSGKTEGLSCARSLLREWMAGQQTFLKAENPGVAPYVRKEVGTGEGMVEAFMDTVTEETPQLAEDGTPLLNDDDEPIVKRVKVRKQVRHNVLFSSDEGRQVLAIAARSGSTIMGTMCTLWSGADSGAANAKAENSRGVDEGSYVLGMLLGFQPGTMQPLFEDQAGGAPQRFAYASTVHPDITADEVEFPQGLKPQWPMSASFQMKLSDKHRRMVREYNAAKNRNEIFIHDLDGHRMLLQCRTAALLALLHSETDVVGDKYWDLAETVVTKSCEYRNYLADTGKRERAEEAKRRQESAIQTNVASALAVARNTKVDDCAGWILEQLDESATKSLRQNQLTTKMKKTWRPFFEETMNYLISTNQVTKEVVDNTGPGPKTVTMITLTD
jgi:hypothetical protein